jgi:transcriptional regulator with XRE-family HTH domain
MLQKDFARLVGVTPQMVSKYRAEGRLVIDADGRVLAAASLEALAGYMDETRRREALEKVRFLEELGDGGRPTRARRPVLAPERHDSRDELRQVQLQMAQLRLALERGELMPVSRAEELAYDAVQAMRQAFDAGLKRCVGDLVTELGLLPTAAGKIERALRQRFIEVQTQVAERMQAPRQSD